MNHLRHIYGRLVQTVIIIALAAGLFAFTGNKADYGYSGSWAYYEENPENAVDIFFIAPTSGHDDEYYMHLEDNDYKSNFVGATAMEKGIYDTKANFYAPYYRQVSLECYRLSGEEQQEYLAQAYADVDEAFNYYIKHINNGRPYILAGFSQGSDMIKRLLENNGNIGDNMIAAYAIGWYFTEEDAANYPAINMAQAEDDTGVVVSFCSEAPEYSGNNMVAPEKTLGINPLNWKVDNTPADKSENLGACFTNYSGEIKNEIPALCGAYRDDERGTLKVTGVSPADYPAALSFLEDGNYHIYDYQFFYRNLQKNVETRIDAYLAAGQ